MSAQFRTDEYARESPAEVVNLDSGERHGYWKYYAPDKWHRQAKIHGKLNNRRAILLLDSGAEVSILDTTFAREAGCQIDTSVAQDCVGIRNETYQTIGRTRVKVTLAGNLVYFLDLWVGDLSGQQAILGMSFLVPAGVRIDSADGTACLPDEVRISLIGRKQLYGAKHRPVYPKARIAIGVGQSANIPLGPEQRDAPQLWVTRGPTWVTSIKENAGRRSSIQVTNIGDKPISLDSHVTVGWWTPVECVPRAFGFVRSSSRRYQEWQNLAFGATSDGREELQPEMPKRPLVDRPTHDFSTRILHREVCEPRQPDDDPPERTPQVNAVFTAAKTIDERRPVESAPTGPAPQNASADMLAGQALQRQGGVEAHNPGETRDLRTRNRLDEVVRPILPDQDPPVSDPQRKTGNPGRKIETPTGETDGVARVQAVVSRAAAQVEEPPTLETPESRTGTPDVLQERVVQRLRLDRIRIAHNKEVWTANLKKFLIGEVDVLSKRDAMNCSKLADRYECAEGDLLHYRLRETDASERGVVLKLVVPSTIRDDVLRHYHASLESGHQGIGRTYQKARRYFHWPGIFASYKATRAQALEWIRAEVEDRAERQNEAATDHRIEVGTQVWLYLDRVKPGYARKLAHLWHGPFRVAEMVDAYAARLERVGTAYQVYPLVHITKLKAVRVFPTRPETRLTVPVDGRFDFEEELLPEDSWEPVDLGDDVFEVEKIIDMREGRTTRNGQTLREFEVKWKGYPDTTWVDELDLNCGGLLYGFLRERTDRNRFQVMHSHENGEVAGPGPDG